MFNYLLTPVLFACVVVVKSGYHKEDADTQISSLIREIREMRKEINELQKEFKYKVTDILNEKFEDFTKKFQERDRDISFTLASVMQLYLRIHESQIQDAQKYKAENKSCISVQDVGNITEIVLHTVANMEFNKTDSSDTEKTECNTTQAPIPVLSKSEQKCLQYSQQAVGDSCTPAPYMALLGYGHNRNRTDWWGRVGVIISDRYILLGGWVAEYFSTVLNNGVKRVALGVTKRSDPETEWQIHEVEASMLHPEYVHPENDIALLKLKTPIQFNDRVQPACLPTAAVNDAEGLVTTWYDRETGKTGDILHSVRVQKYSKEECAASDTRYYASTHDCYANRADLVESCTWIGDPLVEIKNSSCVHTLLGVSSYWSEQCSLPYAYLMLVKYIPWIESVVWPETNITP